MSTNIGEAWEESVLASRGGAIIRIEFNTNELCFLKLYAEDSAYSILNFIPFHFIDTKICYILGGSFAYLRVELGDFVAFIAAGNILLEYVIGGAAVARSWTSYFATLCNHVDNDFRITVHSLPEDYRYLDPIAVVVIAVICVIAVISTKASSRVNYIATIVHIVVIIFIIIAGLTKADIKNYTPFAPFGVRGIFQASAVLFFAYVGFDAVSTMAEETKNPARDIPIGLLGSMVITTFVYCLLAVVLCLMQPYSEVDTYAPYSVAFEAVGLGWAKYIVAVGALKGMTTVLLVGAVGQARYCY
jgi:APA family basic amino acid/polyamine antiporter